ncbi:hypothetical protein BDV96DRAFT_644386 [Lophiotrema nucula]|uniref:Ankyrin repeat-containing domain protein n=1 Tax=Lophiotrema nucula TaxID=690887 RepID=A0A6A5ZG28_9PLEO|nr:hypothetical protein BDV96DRAFT_644386 [Lophiotrema nucula]
MQITDFPTDIFDQIIRVYISVAPDYEVWNARGVCSIFNDFILPKLFSKNSLIQFVKDNPHGAKAIRKNFARRMEIDIQQRKATISPAAGALQDAINDILRITNSDTDESRRDEIRGQYAYDLATYCAQCIPLSDLDRPVWESTIFERLKPSKLRLMAAATVGNIDVMRHYVEGSTNNSHIDLWTRAHGSDIPFQNPLMAAATTGNLDVVQFLVQSVSVAALETPYGNEWLQGALEMSIRQSRVKVVTNILRSICAHFHGQGGCDLRDDHLIHLACHAGCASILRDLIAFCTRHGRTVGQVPQEAFRSACENGHATLVRFLFEKSLAKYHYGCWTKYPMVVAVRAHRRNVVKQLVQKGISVGGDFALDIAVDKHDLPMTKVLVNAGAKISPTMIQDAIETLQRLEQDHSISNRSEHRATPLYVYREGLRRRPNKSYGWPDRLLNLQKIEEGFEGLGLKGTWLEIALEKGLRL